MSALVPRLAVVGGVAVALLVPASQALLDWGQTASEFAEDGDETLRAAGWAFSIWGLIYAGLAAFAVFQLRDRSEALRRVRWPAAAAALGCGLWLVAAGLDRRWLTVAVIAASAVAAVVAAVAAKRAGQPSLAFRLFALWPLSLLAGWLTIAGFINLLTVLTAEGAIPGEARTPAALAGVGAAALVTLAVAARTRLVVYAAPVVWGLVAVAAAARTDGRPVLAAAAATVGLVLALATAWRLRTGSAAREP